MTFIENKEGLMANTSAALTRRLPTPEEIQNAA
jgi:hypothetical protein